MLERDVFVLRWGRVAGSNFCFGYIKFEISKRRCHTGSWIFEPGVLGEVKVKDIHQGMEAI